MIKFYKLLVAIFFFLLAGTVTYSQNNLAPGDIAIVSYQSDFDQTNTFDPLVAEFEDRFSIAILRPGGIAAGTVIYFTDRGWDGPNATWLDNATVGHEGVIKWIVPAGGVAHGSEIYFINKYHDELGAGNEIYTWEAYSNEAGTTTFGVVTTETSLPVTGMDFTVSGDNLLVYQTGPTGGPAGTFSATPIRFITGLLANLVASSTTSAGWDATPVTLNESTIPPGLVNGQTAFVMSPTALPTATVNATSEPDNGKYNCTNSNGVACTSLALSTFIYTTTNWDYNNTQYGIGLTSNHCTYALVPPITITAPGVTQPTCTTPTGTIVVNATGTGTLEYQLNAGSFQLSSTFSGLTPGNYNISVRSQSAPSCVTTYSGNPVVINAAPSGPVVNAPTVTQPTCATPTGTIVVNATGSGTLEYSVDGGSNWFSSNTFSGLAPGSYTIQARLQSNPACVASYSSNPVIINAATGCCVAPTINAPTVTQPSCATPTGTIEVNATGSGTLEYQLNSGAFQLSNTFSGLAPNSYNITVRLQSSPACLSTYSGNPVVLNPATGCCVPPTVNDPTVTQPTCATPTGTIVVNATGSGTLEYQLNSGAFQLSNTFSGLAPNSYNITVRLQSSPACLSTYSGNPVVLNPATGCCVAPSISAPTITQPSCATPTGTIVVNATGSGTLEYQLNSGAFQSSNTFSGLAPNNYNITVRLQSSPACLSTYSGNPVVLNPATGCCVPPTISAPTITQPSCATPTGTIVVNATGSGALEYQLNSGAFQSSNTFSGLAPNSYNITVRLQSSPACLSTYSGNPVVLNAATGCCVPPTINAPTITQPSCATPTGTIVVNATGSGVLEYQLNSGAFQSSNTFSGLAPNSYNITVRLQSSPACLSTYSGNPVVLNPATGCCVPPTISAPTITQPSCATPTGTIVVNASGSGTLEYRLNTGTWQTSNTFGGLTPGGYNISVRLQSSPTCSANYSGNPVVLTAATGCCVAPVISVPTVTQPTCTVLTGKIVVNASSSSTLEYRLNSGTWQTSSTFSGLAPGSYNISVRKKYQTSCVANYSGNPVVLTAATGCAACVLTCPANIIVSNKTGYCGAYVSYSVSQTGSCGVVTYSKASGSFFSIGTTTVTATSSTGASCSFTVTVLDKQKPDIVCPADITVTAASNSCSKVVNFTVTAIDNCPGAVTVTTVPQSGSTFPAGITTVTATAKDAAGNLATSTFTVKVKESQPPVIKTVATPIVLTWPANGSYQTINVSQCVISVTDNCSSIPVSSVKITKVTSDEAENASGDADGSTLKDIKIASDCKSVDLRRERKSSSNGRVYTIYLLVTDASGNTGTATFKVYAPITQGGTTAVDNGPIYTVYGNCSGNSATRPTETITKSQPAIEIPEGFVIEQNYPNPFSTITVIRYALPSEAQVSLGVYNQVGQRVAQLTEGRMSAGYHQARFDATKLAAGIYLYRLLAIDADGKPVVMTKTMIVAK